MKSIYLIWKPSYSPQMLASSLPTACISAQQEPAKSHRSSLTLWSAEHVFVLIFLWFDSLGAPSPPWKLSMLTDTQEALAFTKCPSYQTEVVVLLPNTRFMTNITSIIWGGFVFVCFFLTSSKLKPTKLWFDPWCVFLSTAQAHTAGSVSKKCWKLIACFVVLIEPKAEYQLFCLSLH